MFKSIQWENWTYTQLHNFHSTGTKGHPTITTRKRIYVFVMNYMWTQRILVSVWSEFTYFSTLLLFLLPNILSIIGKLCSSNTGYCECWVLFLSRRFTILSFCVLLIFSNSTSTCFRSDMDVRHVVVSQHGRMFTPLVSAECTEQENKIARTLSV